MLRLFCLKMLHYKLMMDAKLLNTIYGSPLLLIIFLNLVLVLFFLAMMQLKDIILHLANHKITAMHHFNHRWTGKLQNGQSFVDLAQIL